MATEEDINIADWYISIQLLKPRCALNHQLQQDITGTLAPTPVTTSQLSPYYVLLNAQLSDDAIQYTHAPSEPVLYRNATRDEELPALPE